MLRFYAGGYNLKELEILIELVEAMRVILDNSADASECKNVSIDLAKLEAYLKGGYDEKRRCKK